MKFCLDTLLWLWNEDVGREQIRELIENEFAGYCELCPVCKSEWVYEGQWNHYVEDDYMHKVYQNLANGAKSIASASQGLTSNCCSKCYEGVLSENTDNTEGSYIRHLCYEYGTWKEHGCEGSCVHCVEVTA